MVNFGGSAFTYSRHKTGPGKVAVNGHTKNFADVKFITVWFSMGTGGHFKVKKKKSIVLLL